MTRKRLSNSGEESRQAIIDVSMAVLMKEEDRIIEVGARSHEMDPTVLSVWYARKEELTNERKYQLVLNCMLNLGKAYYEDHVSKYE